MDHSSTANLFYQDVRSVYDIVLNFKWRISNTSFFIRFYVLYWRQKYHYTVFKSTSFNWSVQRILLYNKQTKMHTVFK